MINKILDIINLILENSNRLPMNRLERRMSLRNDIGFDSLDLAVFTVNIESEFDVDIFENGNIDTIEEVLERLK